MGSASSVLVVIAAGTLVGFSSVLEWIRLNSAGVAFARGGVGGSATGIDTGVFGAAAIILGSIVVAGALLSLTKIPRKLAWMLVLLGGAVSAALAIFVYLTLDSRFVDFAIREAASAQLPAKKIRTLLETLFEDGSISVRPGPGVIILGVGGVIGLLAGALGWRQTASVKSVRRTLRTPVVAPPSGKGRFGF